MPFCNHCAGEVADGVKFCTHCGGAITATATASTPPVVVVQTPTQQSGGMTCLKWAGIGCGGLLGLLILASIIVYITFPRDGAVVVESPDVVVTENTVSETDDGATPIPTPTPIMVSAGELYSAYESNEVAAALKYDGKMALVDGAISSITEAGSKYDIKLVTEETFSFASIVCKVDRSQLNSVLSLSEGQYITVKGRIKGLSIIDIVVENCSIQDTP